ncbi:hypothetical protein ACIH2S_17320 [Providencia sp. PAZ2]|uniref:hypothetical protein n=1 Tax=Providencia lanzhouensis TaxID=3378099 RepID=UPI003D2BAB2F
MSSNNSEIILDLSSALNDQHIDSSQNLQIDSLEQVKKILNSFQSLANEYKNRDPNKNLFDLMRGNNTIFIHGERGGGKTTFLRSILDEYKFKNTNKKFIPLPLIDPTLFETNQHVLIDIVAKLSLLINDSLTCCKDEDKHLKFRISLEEMAEGLKLLSSNSQVHQYDAAWFLNKALSKSSSGQSLERHFHQFIDTISSILSCDLFIIAIDDVDTKTNKANEILEVIRCYLTHPKLVILLSGDLKLYSHIIRNNKIVEVSADKNSIDDLTLVSHLEQQYLLKVLPIEQRINLKKLDEIIRKNEVLIKYRSNINNEIVHSRIKELLEKILSNSLYINSSDLSSHIDFLINQPVRTTVQLIKTMIDETKSENDNYHNYPQKFKKILYHSFIGSLVKEKIQLDNIAQSMSHINSICFELVNLLYRHGDLETGYYSRPDSNYELSSYNAAKLYISSTISSMFETKDNGNSNISNAIKFMLAGGAVSSIYLTYVAGNLKEKNDFHDYLDYIGLNRNEKITSLAAHFSPIILDQYDVLRSKAIIAGVIRVPKRKLPSFNENEFLYLIESLNIIDSTSDKSEKKYYSLESLSNTHNDTTWDFVDYLAAKTILISSHSAATTTESRDYISVHGLLASLSEILNDNEHINVENLTLIQTYSYPEFLSGKTTGSKEFIDDIDLDSNNTSDLDDAKFSSSNHAEKLENLIDAWKEITVDFKPSSILIGKIWVRLNYTLRQISEKTSERRMYQTERNDVLYSDILISELFSRFIIGLINSTLIEEYRHSKAIKKSNNNILSKARNTNKSSIHLINNINEILNENISFIDDLPLTFKLITCPLLWPFIDVPSERNSFVFLSDILESVFKQEIENTKHNENLAKPIAILKSEFTSITNKLNPLKLQISKLPIMGCFRKK